MSKTDLRELVVNLKWASSLARNLAEYETKDNERKQKRFDLCLKRVELLNGALTNFCNGVDNLLQDSSDVEQDLISDTHEVSERPVHGNGSLDTTTGENSSFNGGHCRTNSDDGSNDSFSLLNEPTPGKRTLKLFCFVPKVYGMGSQ